MLSAAMRDALLRPTLAALVLGGATAAGALTAADVELVRPAPGEVLVGGSEAVVEWTLDGSLGPDVEEWEAFLSVNDGTFYAVRLTPHLDVSRRRFSFRVPDLATDEARILLRFGDERREAAVEVPHRFSIRLPARPVPVRTRQVTERGEPARPGEPGVVAWAEGSRQGDGLTLVRTSLPPAAIPAVEHGPAHRHALVRSRSLALAAVPGDERTPERTPDAALTTADRVRPTSPILLLGCRQNE